MKLAVALDERGGDQLRDRVSVTLGDVEEEEAAFATSRTFCGRPKSAAKADGEDRSQDYGKNNNLMCRSTLYINFTVISDFSDYWFVCCRKGA